MIGVRLNGRMGNQLFQYAFAYATANKLKTGFYLDQSIEKAIIRKYFYLNGSFLGFLDQSLFNIKGFKIFFTYYLRRFFYNTLNNLVAKREVRFAFTAPPDEVLPHIENHVSYEGYFQSVRYFKEFEREIAKQFRIKERYVKIYQDLFAHLKDQKTVVVHVRKADYLNLGELDLGHDDLSLPLSYYKSVFGKLDHSLIYIFISDDREFVKQNFSYLPNTYISYHDEITDFQLMLNADICVISNSTFSWWAAYLNQKENKIVYAPEYFLGWRINRQCPSEIYPADWIELNVLNNT